jgi:hypothetical protein
VTETALQKSILRALRLAGHWPMRVGVNHKRGASGSASAEPGCPDLCVLDLGAWLEVKLPGGKLSAVQQAWHQKARERGVNCAVVMSVVEAVATCGVWKREVGR